MYVLHIWFGRISMPWNDTLSILNSWDTLAKLHFSSNFFGSSTTCKFIVSSSHIACSKPLVVNAFRHFYCTIAVRTLTVNVSCPSRHLWRLVPDTCIRINWMFIVPIAKALFNSFVTMCLKIIFLLNFGMLAYTYVCITYEVI